MLVVMTGLPGTGKTAIAEAIGSALSATVLSADPIDAALTKAGVTERPDIVGYELMKAIADEQLRRGCSVVIDAVCPFRFVRRAYIEIARKRATPIRFIAMTCADPALHRERIEDRYRAGEKEITWAGVERQIAYYEPVTEPAITLDAENSIDQNRAAALAYVQDRNSTTLGPE